jgi:membrane-associated phospholipid phosphatase
MLAARAAALALLAAAAPAAARAEGPEPIRYDLAVDVPITAAAIAVWGGTELAKGHLAPATCRFCGGNAVDDGVRDALVWHDRAAAMRASDVLAFAVIPAAAIGTDLLAARHAGDLGAGLVDVLVIGQAVAIAADLNQLVKLAAGRRRPFARFGDDPARAPSPDDNLSFYSGHTSLAFSFVAATATVATLRGYRTAPWIWGAGLVLAAGAGYFRIAGDMHYLTDVLAGAAAGAAAGVLLPRLMHGRERAADPGAARVALVPFPLGLSGAF